MGDKKGNGFVFVNFNNPHEADEGPYRKAVRSAAAAYSHRVAPRKGLKAAKYRPRPQSTASGSSDPSSTKDRSNSPPEAKKGVKTEPHADDGLGSLQWHKVPSPNPKHAPLSPSPTRKLTVSPLHRRKRSNTSTITPANISKKRYRSRTPSPMRQLIAYDRLPSPALLDASSRDPFDTYPVPYQEWFGFLLDFWYRFTLPRSKNLVKCTTAQIDDYVTWSRGFELTEPALYYTSLFLASGIPVANGRLSLNKALWLRGEAVRALNEALSDPVRATSNAMISAVGKIALHEHIYGDKEAAHQIHRPAQQRMIALRGGVERLGLPNITLQLMIWYDALMAAESQTPAYFADLPRKLALQSYSNDEAVRVTNESSPRRHLHPGYGDKKRVRSSRVWDVTDDKAPDSAAANDT